MGESLPGETSSMKLFSAFLLSLSAVSAEWTCDECAEMSAFMALTASDPAFIERWNELLVIDICPLTTVADTCPITLPWLWTAMAPPRFADEDIIEKYIAMFEHGHWCHDQWPDYVELCKAGIIELTPLILNYIAESPRDWVDATCQAWGCAEA